MSAFLGGGGGGGGISTITEGVTPTSGFTDGYALTSVGNLVEEAPIRTLLQADQAVNVNSATGSDSLTLDQYLAGSAFATLQHAWDFLSAELDLGIFTLTINLAGVGPYSLEAVNGWIGGNTVNILGAGSTVTQCSFGFGNTGGSTLGSPQIGIDQLELVENGEGYCLNTFLFGVIILGNNIGDMAVGPCTNTQVYIVNPGVVVNIFGNVTINGGAQNFGAALSEGFMSNVGNYTLVGTPVYTASFVVASEFGLWEEQGTYSGSATGVKFFVQEGGQINPLNIGMPSALPGSVDGYLLPTGIYAGRGPQTIVIPSSGDTVDISTSQPITLLTPAAPLTSLTISSPALFGSPTLDGYVFSVTTTQAIASLSSSAPDSASFVGFPASLAANAGFKMIYNVADTTWYLTA